jgi:hypothetical protein
VPDLVSAVPGLRETPFLETRPPLGRRPHLSFFLARPVAETKGDGFGWPRAISRQLSAVSF